MPQRDAQLFGGPGQQHHVGNIVLARMAPAFKPIHGNRVAPDFFRLDSVADGCAFVDDFHTGILEHGQVRLRVSAGGFDDFHAVINNRLDVPRIIRRGHRGQKSQVYPEWFVCHLLAPLDFPIQIPGCFQGEPRNDAQAPGTGHGRRQLREPHIMHPPLDDGVLDAEQLGDSRFHYHSCIAEYVVLPHARYN